MQTLDPTCLFGIDQICEISDICYGDMQFAEISLHQKGGALAASCPTTLVGIADSSLKLSTLLLLEYQVIGGLA
eukprot:3934736-Rhodomonas_salina.1